MTVNNPDELRSILTNAKVIAVVGHSDRPHRTSYQIGRILKQWGYTVYPVNPTISSVDGETVYPTLADVPEPIDIVNVFRRSIYLTGVVQEAIAVGAPTVWAQLGVHDTQAVQIAEEAGLKIVTDKCIKVVYAQLVST